MINLGKACQIPAIFKEDTHYSASVNCSHVKIYAEYFHNLSPVAESINQCILCKNPMFTNMNLNIVHVKQNYKQHIYFFILRLQGK